MPSLRPRFEAPLSWDGRRQSKLWTVLVLGSGQEMFQISTRSKLCLGNGENWPLLSTSRFVADASLVMWKRVCWESVVFTLRNAGLRFEAYERLRADLERNRDLLPSFTIEMAPREVVYSLLSSSLLSVFQVHSLFSSRLLSVFFQFSLSATLLSVFLSTTPCSL